MSSSGPDTAASVSEKRPIENAEDAADSGVQELQHSQTEKEAQQDQHPPPPSHIDSPPATLADRPDKSAMRKSFKWVKRKSSEVAAESEKEHDEKDDKNGDIGAGFGLKSNESAPKAVGFAELFRWVAFSHCSSHAFGLLMCTMNKILDQD